MFWFNSCPKCHGDLFRDTDPHGPYMACVQCGHYLSEAEEACINQQRVPNVQPTLATEMEKVAV